MRDVFPITFEVPSSPEPIDYVNQFALGLRGLASHRPDLYGREAGNHYEVPTDLDGITAVRVQVPKNPRLGQNPYAIFDEALRMLVHVNMWCMRAKNRGIPLAPGLAGRRGSYPSVYDAVCYKPKVSGDQELWDSTEALHQRGHGVCEDLACTRVAERLMVGDPCRPFLTQHQQIGRVLFHVVVRNPNGSIEDPSGVLGMTPGRTSPRCRVFLSRSSKAPRCLDEKMTCGCTECKAGKSCNCGSG